MQLHSGDPAVNKFHGTDGLLEKLESLGTKLKKQLNKLDDFTIEELLSVLDMNHRLGRATGSESGWTPADSTKLIKLIGRVFRNHQQQLSKLGVEHVLDAWAEFVHPGDQIVSFNWDLVHEYGLWKRKLWHFLDGYGFEKPFHCSLEWNSQIVIYKLHGSILWFQFRKSDSSPNAYRAYDFFPGAQVPDWAGFTNEESGFLVMLPTYFKKIPGYMSLLPLWDAAGDAISRADEMIVIGYSLNPADYLSRYLIANGLRKNTKLRQIKIISPSDVHWSAFAEALGKKILPISKTFEDWIVAPSA